MSDKGSGTKKNGVASIRKVAKPEINCKVYFVGKWNAGAEVRDELIETVRASITPGGGIKTKLRMYPNGLKVGEKTSFFSSFPEQFYPIECIKSLKRDETNTNTILIVTRAMAQKYEIHVYRCPTEYEARQFVEYFEKYKVDVLDHQLSPRQGSDSENWSLRAKAPAKKYPRAVVATAVNGLNGHEENGIRVDHATKTIHIKEPEPIYATVNKVKKSTKPEQTQDLAERVRFLELENLHLRTFINQNLATRYYTQRVPETEVPVDQLLLLEGDQLRSLTDDPAAYMSAIGYDSSSLNSSSGQFERGSLQYQRTPGSINGYSTQQRNIQTRILVPAETLRRNVYPHTYIPRKIDDVYKGKILRKKQIQIMPQTEYQDVAESLPPRDSISSLSNSDIEDHDANGELFEITTPTPVRYM